MEAVEANCEGALLNMLVDRDKAIKCAEARVQKLIAKMSDASAEQFPKSRPRGHAASDFGNLSEAAQRQARHGNIEYACWFMGQREWRVEDWVTVIGISRAG
eukprot:6204141-Pleurochrysis_carterae.AAC.2